MKTKKALCFLPLVLSLYNPISIDNCRSFYEPMAKGLQCYDSVSFFTFITGNSILSNYDTIEVDYKIVMKSSYCITKKIDSIYVKELDSLEFDSIFWDQIIVYGWNHNKIQDLICTWGIDWGIPIISTSLCKGMIYKIRKAIIDDLETHLYYYEKEDWKEYKDIYKASEKYVFMSGVVCIYDSIAKNMFMSGL